MSKLLTLRTLFAYLILTIAISSPQLSWAAQLIDRVVAVVNDQVITMSEVNDAGKGYFKKITDQAPPAQVEDALSRAREEVLGTLIDKTLITQEAEKQHVSVSDAEIQAATQQMLDNNKITIDMLRAQLDQMGMDLAAYQDTLRNQILQSKLVNYEIRSKLIITEDMILDYYDTHYTKHISAGGYYLMQMGFIWNQTDSKTGSNNTTKEDARKRANRVHALVVGGQDFRTLAQKFSDLPSAADGGDIGVFQEDDMAPYMQDAILKLSPGAISDIIETPSGFQFFKLLSSQDGKIVVQTSFESVKEEIRAKLYEQQLKQQFDEWVKNIKENAYIKRIY